MCENFEKGTEPNSTVVAMMYGPSAEIANGLPVHCSHDQVSANAALISNATMKRSARTTRKGECPSAATSTRMKNQNQQPPIRIIAAPRCQSSGSKGGVTAFGVASQNTMIAAATV